MERQEFVPWLVKMNVYPTEGAAYIAIERGQVPVNRRGRRILISPSAIEKWLEAGCPPADPAPSPEGRRPAGKPGCPHALHGQCSPGRRSGT